jgi:alpha-ketoglutarate-dependent taurine dioxygenase
MSDIRFEPISAELGATVHVSSDDILEDGNPQRIGKALDDFGVLVFPQLFLSDEKLVTLTTALGEMEPARTTADGSGPAALGIYRIALDKQNVSQREYVEGNNYWHMDGTSYQVPGKATLLKCETPPAAGGDTEFAHLFTAYEALPQQKKQQLEGLHVVHCLEAVGRKLKRDPTPEDIGRWNTVFPPTEHPLVWKQRNGRTSLLIGSTANGIVGEDTESGRALLEELLEWCTQSRFTYRHHWRRGDLVIWNNPGLLHRSHPYDESAGRIMHRTTVKGTKAIA